VDNGPLIQAWTKESDKYIPDFEALAEDKHPIVVVVLRDMSSGRILIPSKLVFKYNGTELAFGEDGLCTTEQFAGMFKRVTGYNVSVDSQSYSMTGLRVMRNLVPISGYDNDRITISGEVEIGGHTAEFNELATNVIIQESSGKQYELFITSDKGTQIINPSEVLTLKASLYSGGDHSINALALFSVYSATKEGDAITANDMPVCVSDCLLTDARMHGSMNMEWKLLLMFRTLQSPSMATSRGRLWTGTR
jgi:hypothetical protein